MINSYRVVIIKNINYHTIYSITFSFIDKDYQIIIISKMID